MIAAVRLGIRPWSLNTERAGSWQEHRRSTRTVVDSTRWILRAIRLPVMTRVHVLGMFAVTPPMPDPGNNYGALKAMLDAVVREHVLADDDASHVASVTLFAPERVAAAKDCAVTLILNDTDRKLVCEDCNRSVSDIIAADVHGGACLCSLPHQGIDGMPQPKRGRR